MAGLKFNCPPSQSVGSVRQTCNELFAVDIAAAVKAEASAAVEPPAIRTSHLRGVVTATTAPKSGVINVLDAHKFHVKA